MSEKIILLRASAKYFGEDTWDVLTTSQRRECAPTEACGKKKKKIWLWLPKQQLRFVHIEAKKKKELEYHQGLCLDIWLTGYKMSIKRKFKIDIENKYKMQK